MDEVNEPNHPVQPVDTMNEENVNDADTVVDGDSDEASDNSDYEGK